MENSVTDFSVPIRASVLKFCVHLQEGKVYCVNGNNDVNPYFAFFSIFNFSFFHSYIIYMDIFFCQRFLSKAQSLIIVSCICNKKPHIAYQSLYLFIFLSLQ